MAEGWDSIRCIPSPAKVLVRLLVKRFRRPHPKKVKVLVWLDFLDARVKHHDRRVARKNAQQLPVEQQVYVGA